MTYATLMAHLDVNQTNGAVLETAILLAERFKTDLIGISACQPMEIDQSDGYCDGEVLVAEREIVEDELTQVAAEFRKATKATTLSSSWRSTVTLEPLVDYIANEARSADLIVTGYSPNRLFDASNHAHTGALVMRAGRPVLVVSDKMPRFDRIMIAWKDAAASRRAVSDALPLLKVAKQISVVEIAYEEDMTDARLRIDDVVAWLARHGVTADASVLPMHGGTPTALAAAANAFRADLIVAGAYGHGRLREWTFGGVTQDLLLGEHNCVFLSH